MSNTAQDPFKIITYNKDGPFDFTSEILAYQAAFSQATQLAGELLTHNLQDGTVREGLNLVGWKPEQRALPMEAAAAEWWLFGMIDDCNCNEPLLTRSTQMVNKVTHPKRVL